MFENTKIVAGKKGKMMERRILKDFQIGIVETIVNDAVRGSSEVRDVFSTIAKALNKKQSKKYEVCRVASIEWQHNDIISKICRKEDWNTLVRKNTVVRDPIGSTRNSISRRDRRSLRRRILEEADSGLKMDTDKIVGTYYVRNS